MGLFIAYLLGILTAIKPKNQDRSSHQTSPNPQTCQHSVNGPLSVICIPPTPSSEEEADKKKQERRKTIKFRVEIAGALILLVYAFFTILIWCASKKSADAAKSAAVTAANNLNAFEDSQSAQLVIDNFSVKVDCPPLDHCSVPDAERRQITEFSYKASYTVSNVGPTIANFTTGMESGGTWDQGRITGCRTIDPSAESGSSPNIAPGKSNPYERSGTIRKSDNPQLLETVLTSRNETQAIVLQYAWRDIFHRPHSTIACMYYNFISGTFVPCIATCQH